GVEIPDDQHARLLRRATTGHVAAAPPRSVITKSRRLIASPPTRGAAYHIAKRGVLCATAKTGRDDPLWLLSPASDIRPVWPLAEEGHVWTAPGWQVLSSRVQYWSEQSRPDRNALGSAMLATRAVANAGPTPGIASSRLLVSFDRCQAMMRPSKAN